MKENQKAFSIIELFIIIAVIGALAVVGVVYFTSVSKKDSQTTNTKGDQTTNTKDSQTKNAGTTNAVDSWITIGTQKWAGANQNAGTMISGTEEQTNNNILEKYCYDDKESNCTTYGALYQWSEALQYTDTEGAQGICPSGAHIPTDAEWSVLEDYVGSDTAGVQLKAGGSSGLNLPYAGYSSPGGLLFFYLDRDGYMWSSTQFGNQAIGRSLGTWFDFTGRVIENRTFGFSIRCLKN